MYVCVFFRFCMLRIVANAYIHVIYICRWRLSVLLQHKCGRSRRCVVVGCCICWVAVVGGARRSKHVYHFKVVRMQSIRDHVLIARLYCCDGGSNAPACLTEPAFARAPLWLRIPAHLRGCHGTFASLSICIAL